MTPEQLKASILQRAMEGKLVPQDPNDEPASELLKRIKVEKEKLIKEGKIKRDKKETEIFRGDDNLHYEKFADGTIKEVDVPFEIPESWEWVKIDQLAQAKGGKRVPKGMKLQEEANSYAYLRVTDMKDETILDFKIQYAPKQVRDAIKNYTISSEDLYITIAGTIGNAGTIPKKYDGALLTENALKLVLYPLVNRFYLLRAINSPAIQNQFKALFNQVAQPKLSIRSTNSTLVPLPPIDEQKRIINKIDEMIGLVESYSESHQSLKLINEEFPDKLRKSILQYAMQGKLVPQDPNDEPVEVLLDKIRAEKQRLFEEGKLKKKDLQESIIYKGDDNSYYEKKEKSDSLIDDFIMDTVDNWSYKRLNDIILINTGLSYKKEDLNLDSSGVRIVRGGNIAPMSFKLLDNDYFINKKHINNESIYLKKNQLLTPVSTSLDHVGKIARLKQDYPNTVAGGFVFQFTPIVDSNVLSQYLEYYLSSPIFYNQIKEITNLSGQALYNVPKTKLVQLFVAIPPQNEQLSIIEKVEQFFHLIGQLQQ
ncbi:MAG: restriction endonuclease subunit S [Streptococcaceae bacterium]|jgi:type I restriction enzyme S subunit|nr:restriction endonuclease subunit S [Streptococcaceae bacterium]